MILRALERLLHRATMMAREGIRMMMAMMGRFVEGACPWMMAMMRTTMVR